MRVFVGIDLPGRTRARLAALERGIPAARWVAPENYHLTLAFIGEVDAGCCHDIAAALDTLREPAFAIALRGVGHFGPLQQARALWAGVAPSEALERLQVAVRQRLRNAGCVLPRKRFRPHVTLARLRGETGHHLANILAEHSLLHVPDVPVTGVVLFRSQLSAGGARYDALRSFPLLQE